MTEPACPVCQKTFAAPQGLGGHLAHSKDPMHQPRRKPARPMPISPLDCPVCGRTFGSKLAMDNHVAARTDAEHTVYRIAHSGPAFQAAFLAAIERLAPAYAPVPDKPEGYA